MASLVLGVAGAYVGSFAGPWGARIGWMVGSALGAYIERSQADPLQGPRLADRRVQSSAYGEMIPIAHGLFGAAGNVIWAADIEERSHEEGGKGGDKGGGQAVRVFSYFGTFAVSICAGPMANIQRIWANGRLFYDANGANKGYTAWRFYPGDETQLPDPTIEAHLGAGSVPAYRGQAYVVFASLPLADFSNNLPLLFFEVAESAVGTATAIDLINQPVVTTTEPSDAIYATDGALYWYRYGSGGTPIYRVDPYTGAVLSQWMPVSALGATTFVYLYAPLSGGRFWGLAGGPPGGSGGNSGVAIIEPAARRMTYVTRASDGSYLYGPVIAPCPFGDDLLFIDEGANAGFIFRAARASASTLKVTESGPLANPGFYQLLQANRTNGAQDGTFYYVLAQSGATYQILRFRIDTLQLVSAHVAPAGARAPDQLLYFAGYLYVTANGDLDQWDVSSMSRVGHYNMGGPGGATGSTHAASLALTVDNRILQSGATDGGVLVMNPLNFSAAGAVLGNLPHSQSGIGQYQRDVTAGRQVGASFISGSRYYLYAVNTGLQTASAQLSAVLVDYLQRVGLGIADYDVSLLGTRTVRGTLLSRQMPARSAIEPLANAFYFDGVESDARIKFVPRGAASAASIPPEDLAATGDTVPAVEIGRKQDVDLPRTINVQYFEPTFDYQASSQYARRLAGNSDNDMSIDAPVVLSADEAKGIAETWLYNAWLERTRFAWTTTRKYCALEPTDVVTVKGYLVRINKRSEEGALLRWEGNADASAIYQQGLPGGGAGGGGQDVVTSPPSQVLYLDIPLLRDADDHQGFYLAGNGIPPAGWGGAAVYKSTDSGVNYSAYAAVDTPSIFGGTATSVLGTWDTRNHIFDELNSVSVVVNGTLDTLTEAQVLNGGNLALIGSEVLQFKRAVLTAANTYTLTGLLRGQYGTDWAVGTHAAGDRFVLLTTALRDATHDASELNVSRYYKSVSFGLDLASGTVTQFTDTGVRLKPWAPVDIGGGRQSNNDWTINWKRRTRLSDGWLDAVDVPLGEASESYEVEIMQGATVKRTLTGLATAAATYTAAQQTTDFGSAQTTIAVRVYQLSAAVGRGYPGAKTIG